MTAGAAEDESAAPDVLYVILGQDGAIVMTDARAMRLIRHLHALGHRAEDRAHILSKLRLAAYRLVDEVPA